MSRYSKLFAVSSLFYLLLAGVLGIVMAFSPAVRGMIRFPHVHTMLIGWISMMIFGLAYHVLPRFAGSPLIADFWQKWHWWLANIALIGMIVTPILQNMSEAHATLWYILFFVFGCLQFAGILIFVGTMLKTLGVFPECSHMSCRDQSDSPHSKPCCNEKSCH